MVLEIDDHGLSFGEIGGRVMAWVRPIANPATLVLSPHVLGLDLRIVGEGSRRSTSVRIRPEGEAKKAEHFSRKARLCYVTLRNHSYVRTVRYVLENIEAGKLTEEIRRRGLSEHQKVRAVVETLNELPLARTAEQGGAFDFLADEPDLYGESDIRSRHV
jgi:hypothetical protein